MKDAMLVKRLVDMVYINECLIQSTRVHIDFLNFMDYTYAYHKQVFLAFRLSLISSTLSQINVNLEGKENSSVI